MRLKMQSFRLTERIQMELVVRGDNRDFSAIPVHAFYLMGVLALGLGIVLSCYINFDLQQILRNSRDTQFTEIVQRIRDTCKVARIASLLFGGLIIPYTIAGLCLLRRSINPTLVVCYTLLSGALIMAAFIPILS
jgi:hypothetical protein